MQTQKDQGGVRLQRVLAAAGVGARRACERMIEEGRIRVNGRIIRRLPAFVNPETDRVEADGHPVGMRKRPRPIYLMVNKPEKVLTSTSDEPGAARKTGSRGGKVSSAPPPARRRPPIRRNPRPP